MNHQHQFELKPFDRNTALETIEISGNISRSDRNLSIEYLLTGDLERVIIPPLNQSSDRTYDLWEHTCFEFFFRLNNTTKYWEFNLAPSGNWNIFEFNNYRENIAEAMAVNSLPFTTVRQTDSFQLNLDFDLSQLNLTDDKLDVAISTVIETSDRQLSYWALTHPAEEADFHHPESFAIEL